MTVDQAILFLLILGVFAFLISGRVRYDLVAFAALIIAAVSGVIPAHQIFAGFGHPAVIIVALVLIVSRGLSRSGAIELVAQQVVSSSRRIEAHIGIMGAISAALSSVMNNVAALALLMPLDLQAARRAQRSPAITLMPLSFASILGGMVTLIGTPPNIVIATFREEALGAPFTMFDFSPVGGAVALAGGIFVVLVGWRLVPVDRRRRNAVSELQELSGYVAEARLQESSSALGKSLRELEPAAEEYDVDILGLVRQGKRMPGSVRFETLRKSDLVVLKGSPDAIDQFAGAAGLEYVGSDKHTGFTSEHASLVEVVVPAGAWIAGRSSLQARFLSRQGVTLLGISRTGRRIQERMRKERIRAGDILLLLGPEEEIGDVVERLGCLPLGERGLEIIHRRKAGLAVAIFAAAILAASLGLVYLPLALAVVVVLYCVFRIVPLAQVYESIEWPVIVLLGSMIPLGTAFENSGGTALVADVLVNLTQGWPTVAVLTMLMIVTMTLSDVLNNVATALIAAPIGLSIANRLDANPDAFLMAVAVAASCAFLTPIGHKNNTIIMGPGGYKFGDYWRMGLPLEVIVILVAVPVILIVWPL